MMPRLFFIVAIVACTISANARDRHPSPSKSDTVFVNGLVKMSLSLTAHDLKDIPVKTIEPVKLMTGSGESKRTINATKALLLRDILQKAEVDIAHKERGKYFIVVTAMDGMQVIFAYNELIHGPAAEHAFLLLLDPDNAAVDDGPFAVICTSDVSTVARYVKWVRSIEVRKI